MPFNLDARQNFESTIARVCSSSNMTLTRLDLASDVPNQDVVSWHKKPLKYEPKCWEQEVENMILQGDQRSIDSLCRFGLIGNVYAALNGLEQYSFQKGDLPFSELWDCRLSQVHQEIPSIVAIRLTQQSLHKIRRVPFEAWVRAALGVPSQEIDSFLWQYEYLSVRLYYDFLRDSSPNKITVLSQVKQGLKDAEADPFVHAAIDDALESIVQQSEGRRSKGANTEDLVLRLDEISLHLIIEPLQQLFQKLGSAQSILQQLEVLEVRFRRHYYGSEVKWVPFDTRNEFLDQIRGLGTSGFAAGLSREDMALFQKLNMHSFTTKKHEVPDILMARWNRLSHLVTECVDAGVVDALEIDYLAKELCRLRNFHSLTAVIQGIKPNGAFTKTVQDFGQLLNPDMDYQGYQECMDTRPALHFLFPAQSCAVRKGDLRLVAEIIYMCAFYSVETLSSPEDKREDMQEKTVEISMSSEKMEYCPATPANTEEDVEISGSFEISSLFSIGNLLFYCCRY